MDTKAKKPLRVIAEAASGTNFDVNFEISQGCLLCSNTRTFSAYNSQLNSIWICNECLEAIAYAKQLKAKEAKDLLEPILD